MPLLYYWGSDNYMRDREFEFGFHLNQNSPAMADAEAGESVWAFTRRPRDRQYEDDATFDYGDLAFTFSNGLMERVEENRHLPVAS